MLLVLLAGLALARGAAADCMAEGSPCSPLLDMTCCGDMVCLDTCQPPRPAEESFVVTFYQHANFSGRDTTVTLYPRHLGQCKGFEEDDTFRVFGLWLNGQTSSLKWSSNVVLVVYDSEDCGGNSHMIYTAGPYQYFDPKDNSETEAQGFLAGRVHNLAQVCRRNQCGSSSSTVISTYTAGAGGSPSPGPSTAAAWNRCKCKSDWNDVIRSYRVFKWELAVPKIQSLD